MRRTRRALLGFLITVLAGATAVAAEAEGLASPGLRAHGARTAPPAMLGAVAQAKGLPAAALPVGRDKACVLMSMTCNSTVNGALTADDCIVSDEDPSFIDFWEFQGTAGQTVTINMMSSAFDTFLFLIDPVPEVVDFDDDSGAGTNSRLVHTLGSSGLWTIGANAFSAGESGNYTLMLECTGTGPTPPAAPSNLTAAPLSSTEVELGWQDNSNNEDEFRVEVRMQGTSFTDIGGVAANSTAVDVFGLNPATTYDFRVRARNAAGDSPYSNVATATTFAEGADCTPTATNLCLLEGRFRVEVQWRDFDDNTGQGMVVPFGSPDSGLFWFFAPDNWEMLVKMVDACDSPFDSFWVFAAATTNVEYTLRVTDTETGFVREYPNPLGTSSPAITDTQAFSTCP